MVSPDSDRVSRVRTYSGTSLAYDPSLTYGTITLYRPTFQKGSAKIHIDFVDWPYNPKSKLLVWALPTSLAATMGISFDFFSSAYLDVSLQQVLLPYPMYSGTDDGDLFPPGFPIRNSTAQCFFPTPRSLSQVSTSFVASRCQGIHQQLLVT